MPEEPWRLTPPAPPTLSGRVDLFLLIRPQPSPQARWPAEHQPPSGAQSCRPGHTEARGAMQARRLPAGGYPIPQHANPAAQPTVSAPQEANASHSAYIPKCHRALSETPPSPPAPESQGGWSPQPHSGTSSPTPTQDSALWGCPEGIARQAGTRPITWDSGRLGNVC